MNLFNKKVLSFPTFISLCGISGLISCLGSNPVYANSKTIENLQQQDHFIYQGNLKLINSKLNTAEIQGSNHLFKNNFTGNTAINGNSELRENDFNQLLKLTGNIKSFNNTFNDKVTINGNLKDNDSHFMEELSVIGKADLANSELTKDMSIDSNEVRLENCHTSGINFINKEDARTVKLYLTNNTKINGDINFSNQKGKVYKDSNVVIEGSVNGGEVINN